MYTKTSMLRPSWMLALVLFLFSNSTIAETPVFGPEWRTLQMKKLEDGRWVLPARCGEHEGLVLIAPELDVSMLFLQPGSTESNALHREEPVLCLTMDTGDVEVHRLPVRRERDPLQQPELLGQLGRDVLGAMHAEVLNRQLRLLLPIPTSAQANGEAM